MPTPRPPIGPAEALIVVGNADNTANTGDEVLENFVFDQMNMFVTIADDADDSAQFGRDIGVVVISSSTNGNTVQDEYLNTALPVICMDDLTLEEMQMVEENDGDTDNEQEIEIVEENHPIVANLGLSENEVEVYDDNNDLTFGDIQTDALIIASNGNNDEGTIFAYEPGEELAEDDDGNTRLARNYRLGFFVTEPALNDDDLNATGEQILENAINYTWRAMVP
jgi:hypothetical protein